MRADIYLVSCGFVESRQRAQQLIEKRCVTLDGKEIVKSSEQVTEGKHQLEIRNIFRYVGRGGLKLEAALDAFRITVAGKRALDIGASTGGFTDCLLQRGAARVCAVDSGAGQLAEKLRKDERVVSLEHRNARELTVEEAGGRADLIVMDVSFISATYLIPKFTEWLEPCGDAVCLIKPQFEVGRAMVGKGGIVRDPAAHLAAVNRVFQCATENGLFPIGLIPSPITGGDGNREFLSYFTRELGGRKPLLENEIRFAMR